MTTATIAAHAAGDMTDQEALRFLASNLGEVESDLAPLQKEREQLRAAISAIVTRLGGRGAASGLVFAMTAPGETISYDSRALDGLSADLLATGDAELVRIAARIAQARKTSIRAGSLRVTKGDGR